MSPSRAPQPSSPPCPAPSKWPELFELCAVVKRIALREHTAAQRGMARVVKADGSWVTDVDQRIQDALGADLRRRWPQYGFIGEEMPHAEQAAVCRLAGAGYWVLDPLDGTTNFTAGLQFYGVSLALVIGGAARLGVVFDPVRGECFAAQQGRGAYRNRRRLACSPPGAPRVLGDCIAVVDYKRLVGDLTTQLVRKPPYRSQRNFGSSALEWCWLAAGRFHLYLHGGQKLWDFAAGHLILSEAGGAATSLSGAALNCAKLRKRSVVAAANIDLLRHWGEWIEANSAAAKLSPL